MGLYPIACIKCCETFMWFSGNPVQMCENCLADEFMKENKELMDDLAKIEEQEKKDESDSRES